MSVFGKRACELLRQADPAASRWLAADLRNAVTIIRTVQYETNDEDLGMSADLLEELAQDLMGDSNP